MTVPSPSSPPPSTPSAWEAAFGAAEEAGVRLRHLEGVEDARKVEEIVDLTWGPANLPFALIRAFQHGGGAVFGAEIAPTDPARQGTAGRFVGFVLGFLGYGGGLHLHSHMLAVLPEEQSRGVGLALKLAQRADCLAHGVEEVRWTYDPLVAKNARFNLVKLGGVATAYLPGFYGEMTDRLNRGDRSDRFEVRWRLASERVQRAIRDELAEPKGRRCILSMGPHGEPVGAGLGPSMAADPDADPTPGAGPGGSPSVVLTVPLDHHALKERDPVLARRWRDASGKAFAACFEAGLVATWVGKDGTYVFEHAGPDVSEPAGGES
jgi:predicted GNAT superfamily acetyltransferase